MIYPMEDLGEYGMVLSVDGIGKQIGVCGEGAENGGVEGRLWMREDISLGFLDAKMISAVTVVYEEEESASIQTEDPVLIGALLAAYNDNKEQVEGAFLDRDGWSGSFLILHHKDYPFLQYRIQYCCHLEQERAVFCQRNKLTWSALPEEWLEFLTQCALPQKSSSTFFPV